jgi:hypothetical protein
LTSVPNIRWLLWWLNYALHDTNAAWIFQAADGVLINLAELPARRRCKIAEQDDEAD